MVKQIPQQQDAIQNIKTNTIQIEECILLGELFTNPIDIKSFLNLLEIHIALNFIF